ncbi:Pre-mRNA-processing-splicing factor 8 [Tritrichomonas foetus]|uniref:Pre-mRNA-processing-splicing factor 8 n=1 Tax=Tritrichomonas foetus TaxID=1144522 RepID=A0A1J4K2J4_9EUKA|nr:Pre-mRNA-processing-splicing factor 8 [Tritrichomonas foetus]|eukprot:OHT05186.1 Pre-mRNA-processing-splicing factor 8 [Tritrichomonas foetus]
MQVSGNPNQDNIQKQIRDRVSEWKRLRKRHFQLDKARSSSKTIGEMPPGHIRQIIKAHADMSHPKFAGQKRLYIGALKYLPHAVLKLIENMPMPWEDLRYVRCLYHTAGAITFINEVPRVIPPHYIAQWATVWIAMRREKRDRSVFRRLRFPPFDDEEIPTDFVTMIDGVELSESVKLELDPDEDHDVYDWFYDHLGLVPLSEDKSFKLGKVNGLSYKKWWFPLSTMSTLFRLSRQLVGDYTDPNTEFLFDLPSLFTSKALNETIPGGPRYEPLFKDIDPNEEWNEFNDINKIIVRIPITTEHRVAYPFLYNNRPRKVSVAPFHHPSSSFIPLDSPELEPFFIGNVYPIEFQKLFLPQKTTYKEPLELDFDPLFSELGDKVYTENTFDTLSLFWAPQPFNSRSGKTQRAQDVPLLRNWYRRRSPLEQKVKVRVSYQKLLKNYVLNRVHHRKHFKVQRKKTLFKILKASPYFYSTTLDWVEAGLQIITQGFNMCNLLIRRHRLVFLHLDYNFNLKPIKTLNTKERRKSRFGNGFHLIREFLKFVKMMVDCQVKYRLGQIDAYELADALQYVFAHAGHLTGLYRYKYKIMHQVRACKDLKHVIYSRFNMGAVQNGPGVGFWGPMWRVWVFFMRGMVPLMERWLNSRISREYEGRVSKRVTSNVTKQRIESHYDLELRASIMHDILDVMPEGIKQNKAHTVMAHLSEAWRCWKANIPWKVPGINPTMESLILRYVKSKANWWVSNTHYARERISREGTIDKAIIRKSTARLTRLYFKKQSDIQASYLKEGPYIGTEESVIMLKAMSEWLESRKFQVIPFPPMQYKHDTKMLVLALESLRFGHDVSMRMNQILREELGLIEHAHDNPHETLNRVKRNLFSQRAFREVKFDFLDMYTRLVPVYEVDALEKITDAYLDQYLWYEADKRQLFPNWVKPSDKEPPQVLIYKWCQAINNLTQAWNTEEGQCTVMLEMTLENFYEKADLTFLNYLLRLVVDYNLADYMTAKNNVKLYFKDMSLVNSYGLIHGLQFTSFIFHYMGLLVDLLFLGMRRAADLAGPRQYPNDFLTFSSVDDESRHPIRFYQRYGKRVHILFKFTESEARDLIKRFLSENPDPNNQNIVNYNNKKCWPRDARMRLVKHDVNLGRAVFWLMQNQVPRSIVTLDWDSTFASVYSKDNPNLLFYMCGFEVRILPKCRMEREDFTPMEGTWILQDMRTQERTGYVFLRVSEKSILYFKNRTRQILLSSQATTFAKVSNKWNTHIISFVSYYREALVSTPELLDIIVKSENKVLTRVKLGLNSKMPQRFPPVVFYAPKEFGGLGLLSMGHILIPQSDLKWAQQTTIEATHFRAGMDHKEANFVPALYRYVQTWEGEITDSQRVWSHYASIRQEASLQKRQVSIEDLDSLWDRGIPRINTLFQKDRHTLAYDRGWRTRLYFKRYSLYKTNPFGWTHYRHDGKLWNLHDYRADVIQALGGVEGILSHSIFNATGYKRWEGLFWDCSTGFEEAMKYRRLTNAQRQGLSQVPNRRFTMWWSPTINRANVYIGFQVQLDLTGIFMHGKIPTLKISMIQLFRAHMWQKIHESVAYDLVQMLDNRQNELQINTIIKQVIHPRKSYKMNASCADIIMVSSDRWEVSDPTFITDNKPNYSGFYSNRFWIDVQLRWGDYDSHDIERYTRGLFSAYTMDTKTLYPSETGVMVGIDLCYNTWTVYGTFFRGLQEVLMQAMKNVMSFNPSISVFRERVRKSLQLYSSDPSEPALNSSNFGELFGNKMTWLIDDTNTYRVKIHKSFEGNYVTTPVNGGVFIMNPGTGQLFLKIIHTGTWKQQKRLAQLAKWKAAEEITALVRTLPHEEQPRQIICTRELLLDPLQLHLAEFPNINVKGSDMYLPLPAFMKIPKLADVVIHSPEPKMVLFNLYDDWLSNVSPYTAFSRLMLVMRSLSVNKAKAWDILRPTADIVIQPDHLWPTHSAENWIKIELKLKDLVIEDYARKNSVPANALTQSEIRDIILGVQISPPSDERQQLAAEESLNSLTAITTRTTTKTGENIVVQTLSNFEQTQYQSKSDWRKRAIKTAGLSIRTSRFTVPPDGIVDDETTKTFIMPLNIMKKFVRISDPYVQVCAILFGQIASDDDKIVEVHCFIIPPQTGNYDLVEFPKKLPTHPLLGGLQPVGWIHTCATDDTLMAPSDAITSSGITDKNSEVINDTYNFASIVISYPPGSCIVRGFRLNEEGQKWSSQNRETKDRSIGFEDSFFDRIPIILTETYNGFFMVPQGIEWNMNFQSLKLIDNKEYDVELGQPLPFYDQRHRPNHFLKFVEDLMTNDMSSIDYENNFA